MNPCFSHYSVYLSFTSIQSLHDSIWKVSIILQNVFFHYTRHMGLTSCIIFITSNEKERNEHLQLNFMVSLQETFTMRLCFMNNATYRHGLDDWRVSIHAWCMTHLNYILLHQLEARGTLCTTGNIICNVQLASSTTHMFKCAARKYFSDMRIN